MKLSHLKETIKKHKGTWSGVFWIAVLYILLAVSGHGCPIRLLTGIPCPGCGLSRAFLALLHLDLAGAFSFHPMFWAVPILAGAAVWYDRKGSPGALILLMVLGAGFLIAYLWRLALGDPAVCADPSSGLIFRLLSQAALWLQQIFQG